MYNIFRGMTTNIFLILILNNSCLINIFCYRNMEVFMIKSRFPHYAPVNLSKIPSTQVPQNVAEVLELNRQLNSSVTPANRISTKDETMNSNYTLYPSNDMLAENTTLLWNNSALFNLTNNSDYNFDYDYQTLNVSVNPDDETWALCNEWSAAQHNLFQTANLFFAAAFLVPMSFKQSVLLVR